MLQFDGVLCRLSLLLASVMTNYRVPEIFQVPYEQPTTFPDTSFSIHSHSFMCCLSASLLVLLHSNLKPFVSQAAESIDPAGASAFFEQLAQFSVLSLLRQLAFH